ncbi:uncharacterized protein VTP21DRAFT_7704 [Calcarisporiella thermophila]|uniref:uncharacterized protein n=1 Tax=Calcarisporiella thermophila TaxID=911321 RepID=UPI003742D4BC
MGSGESKPETLIFYNSDVPIRFSADLVHQLEAERGNVSASREDIERQVRARVQEELKRLHEQQEELREQSARELEQKNSTHLGNAVVTERDIEAMIEKTKKYEQREIPREVKERQEAVIACYLNNKTRPLDCWEEVQTFKESVHRMQKEFVAAHQ